MTYQQKVSFDGKEWYQLEWEDIDFKTFSKSFSKCKSIDILEEKVYEKFPESNFTYTYIGKKTDEKRNIRQGRLA